jgi:hypothetical protein
MGLCIENVENKWKFANEMISEIKFKLFMYEVKKEQVDIWRIKPNARGMWMHFIQGWSLMETSIYFND